MSLKDKFGSGAQGKKSGKLLGVLVFGAFIAWQVYDGYQRTRVRGFADSYNAYNEALVAFGRSAEELGEREADVGTKFPELVIMRLMMTVDTLATDKSRGCSALPDRTLRNSCVETFSGYHKTLAQVQERGADVVLFSTLMEEIARAKEVQQEVLDKYPRYIKLVDKTP